MWRSIHSWIGLLLALLVMVMSVTGTILATKPIYENYQIQGDYSNLTVAEVVKRIAESNSRVDPQKLSRSPSGEYILSYSRRGKINQRAVDLSTGKFVREMKEPETYEFIRKLHRSFLLGEKGRLISAVAGIVMAVLLFSGLMLLVRRLGGWKQLLTAISWRNAANQHAGLGRIALLPLLITTLTALWLSAVTFHWVSSGDDVPPKTVESLKKLDPVKPWTLHGLQEIKMADVEAVIYPIPEDWTDSWAVQTHSEMITVDQFTGDILYRDSLPLLARIMAWVRFLHTGEGSTAWSLVLLLSSLTVPFFALTGIWIWWQRQRKSHKWVKHNARADQAGVLIAVGSESGSTWRFAKALHVGFHSAGYAARMVSMNAVKEYYPKLTTFLVLTSTYGDGVAPKSATKFLSRMEKFRANDGLQHATLGFGDRIFTTYCAYGKAVAAMMNERFGQSVVPFTDVDKESAQTFSHWCQRLGQALNKPLDVHYEPKRPKTRRLVLESKQVYGESLGTIISVLRFRAKKLPGHRPGDLVAIYPHGAVVPRLYSLGSDSKKDGYLEICVRLQEGGLCSPWLCAMEEGTVIDVNVQDNERFHLPKSNKPVIMVGAGTGIAPFTGMIRHNDSHRVIELFWGGRDPASDGLYATEIEQWLDDKRLTRFSPAWSRVGERQYVQDQIKQAGERLKLYLQSGGIVMVCGGQAMARAVRSEFDEILRELDISVEELQRKQRYFEDVY